MARIRTIKPSFCVHRTIVECSTNARLLFILMWCFCDDAGIHVASPRQLKMEVFPGDDSLTVPVIEGLVAELIHWGHLVEYEVDGQRYWHVSGWKHQKIDRPQPSHYPPPDHPSAIRRTPDTDPSIDEHSSNDRRAIDDRSRRIGKDRKGKDRKGGTHLPAPVEKPTGPVWSAYAAAYQSRYGAEPVRNAKVNGQLAALVKRLGVDEAPAVAAWYVGHANALYVRSGHCVDLLVRDCEKLRTEWITQRSITESQARTSDRRASTASAFAGLLDGVASVRAGDGDAEEHHG